MSQADDDDKQPARSRPDDSGAIAVASGNRQTALALKKRPTRPRKRNIGDLSRHIAEAGGGVRLASLAELVRLFGVSEKTMRGWLRMLEQQGKIEREKLPNGILKLVWNGVGGKRPRTSGRTSPRPELTLVQGTSGMTGSVSPSPSPRRVKKPKETSEVEPISQAGALSVTDPQEMLQRTSEGTQERTSERTLPVSADGTEVYTAPPVPTIPLTVPRPRWWQGRSWLLTIIASAFLVVSLTQATLHAAERAHGDLMGFILIGAMALGVGLAAPVCLHEAVKRADWRARYSLVALGLAAFVINAAGSLGYTGARASMSAAEGQASVSARSEAEADLKRLRERQAQLDLDAEATRTADGCKSKKRAATCRANAERIVKQAAALSPLIEAARAKLDTKEVKAAADPAAAFIADFLGLKDGPVRQAFVVGWTLFAEAFAAFGFALAIRRTA